MFFKMNNPSAPLAHKTINMLSDEKRPIFFFSDVPHLFAIVGLIPMQNGVLLYMNMCKHVRV